MSSNSINVWPLNINEKWSNFIQVAPANTGDFPQILNKILSCSNNYQ